MFNCYVIMFNGIVLEFESKRKYFFYVALEIDNNYKSFTI